MTGPNRRDALAAVATLAGLAAAPASAQTIAGLNGYAINLDTWCKQVPFEQRFPLARKLGFRTIEFWTVDGGNGTKASDIKKLVDDSGLEVTQFAPAWPNFADQAKLADLLKVTEQAIADAKTSGLRQVHRHRPFPGGRHEPRGPACRLYRRADADGAATGVCRCHRAGRALQPGQPFEPSAQWLAAGVADSAKREFAHA